jgi:hypothetical protein
MRNTVSRPARWERSGGRLHPEAKFTNADFFDSGLTKRRHIKAPIPAFAQWCLNLIGDSSPPAGFNQLRCPLAKLSLAALVSSLLALTLSTLTCGRLEGPWPTGGLP